MSPQAAACGDKDVAAPVGRSLQKRPRLLIVDGHAYAYRAFHAIAHLNAPDGAPTNAIFGFMKALTKLRESLQPDFLAVIWDGGLDEERLAALPGYKSQRPPMPDDLEVQLDQIAAYLEAAGLAGFCQDGVEADDWIAVMSRRAVEQGIEVVIASSDKDFMQLVASQVGLLNPNDKSGKVWGEEHVREKAGVAPSQITDWLSLIGDSVDNIPGVSGVGPKTATDLLGRFGSVESLYQRLGEVKSDRLRDALRAAEADVRRNQRLIQLRDDLPLAFELEKLRPGPGDPARLDGLFQRWGFRSRPAPPPPELMKQGEFL